MSQMGVHGRHSPAAVRLGLRPAPNPTASLSNLTSADVLRCLGDPVDLSPASTLPEVPLEGWRARYLNVSGSTHVWTEVLERKGAYRRNSELEGRPPT